MLESRGASVIGDVALRSLFLVSTGSMYLTASRNVRSLRDPIADLSLMCPFAVAPSSSFYFAVING